MPTTIIEHDGHLIVTAPFHPDFPARARMLGGAWDGARKAWLFDPRDAERVRTLCREIYGTDNDEPFADYELLEVILFAAQQRGDVKPVAKALIAKFGSFAAVMAADRAALDEAGLSLAAIAAIKAARETAFRVMRAELQDRPVVNSWDTLLAYCQAQVAHSTIEEFHILFLDRKNALIKHERQQRGTVDLTPVYPREVVKRALELDASALILVHNHPSGDPTPSTADIAVTKEIKTAADALGVALHDHLIIGRDRHVSFRDLKLI
jgi:DNA repair protein RadC